jgi:hypothetical protein
MRVKSKQLFKEFNRSSLALDQYPAEDQDSLRYMMRDLEEAGDDSFFETTEEVTFEKALEFLDILSASEHVILSRENFRDELMFFLSESASLEGERDFYSVRVLSPTPFNPSPPLVTFLRDKFPVPLANNAAIGYLMHHNLIDLVDREESLRTLLTAYLRECNSVEFKTLDVSGRKSVLLEVDLTD